MKQWTVCSILFGWKRTFFFPLVLALALAFGAWQNGFQSLSSSKCIWVLCLHFIVFEHNNGVIIKLNDVNEPNLSNFTWIVERVSGCCLFRLPYYSFRFNCGWFMRLYPFRAQACPDPIRSDPIQSELVFATAKWFYQRSWFPSSRDGKHNQITTATTTKRFIRNGRNLQTAQLLKLYASIAEHSRTIWKIETNVERTIE